MHDLDRTVFEAGPLAGEYEGEYEHEQTFEAVLGGELEGESGELNEAQEIALANELLEVTNEQELENFLGSLLAKAGGAARRLASSPTGQQLTGILRQAAKKALPVVGRAAGQWVRPGGGAAGARIAASVGDLFGLELEGLSAEDQEFEVARGFVRFAADAARRAAAAPPAAEPSAVARTAATAAARSHAPGLLPAGSQRRVRRLSGRWERRGSTIVVHGI